MKTKEENKMIKKNVKNKNEMFPMHLGFGGKRK